VAGVVLGMETINQAKSGTAKVLFAICPLVLVAVAAKLLSRNLQVARSHGTLFFYGHRPRKGGNVWKAQMWSKSPERLLGRFFLYIYNPGIFIYFLKV
jgi:hypothetical protein